MRETPNSNIRVTLSDLNIPSLYTGIGITSDSPNTLNTKQSSSVGLNNNVGIDKSMCDDSQEPQNNNSNNLNMQEALQFNVPFGPAANFRKGHTVTRKDKALFDLFTNHLENQLRYTDPEFNLKNAARELGTNEKYLSSAINNCSGISFNALVNRYRIAHAKKLIYDDVLTRQNLEEIAYMSGYGNRTTFYRVFTELEGVTPSRFRDNYNKDFSI